MRTVKFVISDRDSIARDGQEVSINPDHVVAVLDDIDYVKTAVIYLSTGLLYKVCGDRQTAVTSLENLEDAS